MTFSVMTPDGLVAAKRWVMTPGGLVGGGGSGPGPDPDPDPDPDPGEPITLYQEGFESDNGGWEEVTSNGYAYRSTNNQRTGTGCLGCEAVLGTPSAFAGPAFLSGTITGGSMWLKRIPANDFGTTGALVAIIECNFDGEAIGDPQLVQNIEKLNDVNDYIEIEFPETSLVEEEGTHHRIMVILPGPDGTDPSPHFVIDDIVVEGVVL